MLAPWLSIGDLLPDFLALRFTLFRGLEILLEDYSFKGVAICEFLFDVEEAPDALDLTLELPLTFGDFSAGFKDRDCDWDCDEASALRLSLRARRLSNFICCILSSNSRI